MGLLLPTAACSMLADEEAEEARQRKLAEEEATEIEAAAARKKASLKVCQSIGLVIVPLSAPTVRFRTLWAAF